MALVSSVQHLAPLMNSMLTSERPRMHLRVRHAGEPAPTCPLTAGLRVGPGFRHPPQP